MARQLWLLRHAEAEPHGARPDFERRLTERGERQSRLVGLALARMGVEIEKFLSSPKERALRTATLALQAWDEQAGGGHRHGDLIVHAPLQHGFGAAAARAATARLSPNGRLLMVGHEPDFSEVVGGLTGARVDLKKAGLAVVRLESADAGSGNGGAAGARSDAAGELVLLLRPAELALIASVALTEA
jgi:phosphohistidine phosphatase